MNEIVKQFFYKGRNYQRSGMTVDKSIEAAKVAFDKATKLGIDRRELELAFRMGFEDYT